MHRDSLPARRRYTRLAGSADALALARLAQAEKPLARRSPRPRSTRSACVEEIAWFAPQLRVCLLPDWETLPYDQFSPHQDLVSERLATLYRIQRGDFDVAVVPAPTALVRLCPPVVPRRRTRSSSRRESSSRLEALRAAARARRLPARHAGRVAGRVLLPRRPDRPLPDGQSALPYRLDLDDDVIEAIKTFDVDTQRTLYAVKEIRMLPAREFPLDDAGRARFRSRWRELFEGDPSKKRLYRDVSNGVPAAGIEYYLPLFFESRRDRVRLPARRRARSRCTATSPAPSRSSGATPTRATSWLGGDPDRPLLPPAQLFVPAEEFYRRARRPFRASTCSTSRTRTSGPARGAAAAAARRRPARAGSARGAEALPRDARSLRVLIAAESPGRRETMASYFAEYGLKPDACASFEDFVAKPSKLHARRGAARARLRPARRRLGGRHRGRALRRAWCAGAGARAEKRSSVEGMLRDLSELKVGDPVVHEQHGIGRYLGLVRPRPRRRRERVPAARVRRRRQALRAGRRSSA